jgi:predicted aspartyl protease
MRKRTYVILSLWIMAALCWAFVFILKYTNRVVFVCLDSLEAVPGVRLLDPNAGLFEIVGRACDRVDVNWSDTHVRVKGDARAKMRENSKNVQVWGTLKNGKRYPVVIDTGFSGYLAVTDTVVMDAGLAIYPVADFDQRLVGGFCDLPSLTIGNVTIEQSPCVYWLAHYERRVLGLTAWKQMKMMLGLSLMRGFSYLCIDHVEREVEFVVKRPFDPQDERQWDHYPMVIEPDEKGDAKLMVNLPIAGHVKRIGFDTGASSGLILTEGLWAHMSRDLQLVRAERHRLATPLANWLPCRRITVDLLRLGNTPIRGAQIDVTANNNPMGEDDFTLGMGFFQETVIVLDFGRGRLWIRRPSSR